MRNTLLLGIDIGSTTVKVVALDAENSVIYADYRRHNMNVRETVKAAVAPFATQHPDAMLRVAVTGSVGMGYAECWHLPFVQEVIAAATLVKTQFSATRTFIDIGGEDSKMIFFEEGRVPDIRMNGNCAGGTGAFIDQTAGLLNVSPSDLNALAEHATNIHPIASRCGVFSKTDIQNLLARHVSKEDVALSVFHAVSLQVIGTLSRGLDVQSPVFFCGGPFAFLPMLKKCFLDNLHLTKEDCVQVPDARVVSAHGTAIMAETACADAIPMQQFVQTVNDLAIGEDAILLQNRLAPLFSNKQHFEEWRHQKQNFFVPRVSFGDLKSDEVVIGVDSGSTTTKLVVLDAEGRLLFTDYRSNNGNSFDAFAQALHAFQKACDEHDFQPNIVNSAVTGYGENLLKTGYGLHHGIVETMAHYLGAKKVSPDVSFILDIGGQDMKAIFVENQAIRRLEINEACSSGCGSFIETFAKMLGYTVGDFARIACEAPHPYDLGTRCTVFMNSKVKQAMREGTTAEDISAGFAYSVIKNCLFKVLKLRRIEELGDHIVVQGGTFKNLAVVRALELLTDRDVRFSDIPELMGAYGCALFAKEQPVERVLTLDELLSIQQFQTEQQICPGCPNHCTVVQYKFSNGNRYYSGNNCEKIFANISEGMQKGKNQHHERLKLMYRRPLVPVQDAKLKIGIPRALGTYELYPFWHALFSKCGFTVLLSSPSTVKEYEKGLHTVMSENICFPAKLMHGHVYDLAERGVDRIFYPYVVMEQKADAKVRNSYNCPIVAGYSDVIRNAIDTAERFGIPLDAPVVSFNDEKLMRAGCLQYLKQLDVDRKTAEAAIDEAVRAQKAYLEEQHRRAVEIVREARKNNRMVVVLAGRPYHSDPLVQHKISDVLADMGIDVVTEFIAGEEDTDVYKELMAVTQWTYPNRVFKAAHYVANSKDNIHFMMITSFGCGPDAFIIDEAHDILDRKGKSFTLLKVDDVNNIGSLRLRVRSMVESLRFSHKMEVDKPFVTTPPFQVSDRRRTIIGPYFADGYSEFIPTVFKMAGYNLITLPMGDKECVELGLQYANNEVCYPATIVVGSLLKALRSGDYNVDDVAVIITQTGGQCRATNYIMLIKKALVAAGFENVPVLSLALGDTLSNEQPGFSFNARDLALPSINTLLYADSLSRLYYASRPRELQPGMAKQLRQKYIDRALPLIEKRDYRGLRALLKEAAGDFAAHIDIHKKLPQIGVVGEIYVKYNTFGHLNVLDWLADHGVEVIAPSMYNFFMNSFVNRHINKKMHIHPVSYPLWMTDVVYKLIYRYARSFDEACAGFPYYRPYADMFHDAKLASQVINMAANFGEGWLIPAEMSALAESGVHNIVSLQPFACISNHVIAKGIERKIRQIYPKLNLLFLDFDGGTSEANVFNRLHFMMENG
ncbi:MAG: acyl-CoA dehydratase activase-related protein [Bacteroidales bacterium]|nr:acyl-CoA dehydratase activase-related protein [Bacteroidales bacterium]